MSGSTRTRSNEDEEPRKMLNRRRCGKTEGFRQVERRSRIQKENATTKVAVEATKIAKTRGSSELSEL